MAGRLGQHRLLQGILIAFLSLSVLLSINSREADATANYGPLVTAALKYEGQNGGQCYMFIQKVVKEVTGRLISGDYRQGYIDAGATEVPLAQAQSGDIIQLINDKNTAADANYAGLHTTLIMDVRGDGKFKVIDSNYLFDEMIRVHDDYSPQESAARYKGISVHVWRVPPGKVTPTATPKAGAPGATATGTSTASATPGGSSARSAALATPEPDEEPEVRLEPLEPGSTAVIAADGDCLRLRDEAGLDGEQVACPPTGAFVRILEGSEVLDGYRWQLVQSGPVIGWAADMYLDPAGNAVSAAAFSAGTDTVAETAPEVIPPSILSGEAPPPVGGYALFVFSGGTYEDLLTVSGCGEDTATFWATSVDGAFVWYLPAVTVAAVNAPWEGLFAGAIPSDTALMGRCI